MWQRLIIAHKNEFLDHKKPEDDLLIGRFLISKDIKRIDHGRMSFYTLEMWYQLKDQISADIFHFRIKTSDEHRLTDDIYIHSQLLKMFY